MWGIECVSQSLMPMFSTLKVNIKLDRIRIYIIYKYICQRLLRRALLLPAFVFPGKYNFQMFKTRIHMNLRRSNQLLKISSSLSFFIDFKKRRGLSIRRNFLFHSICDFFSDLFFNSIDWYYYTKNSIFFNLFYSKTP